MLRTARHTITPHLLAAALAVFSASLSAHEYYSGRFTIIHPWAVTVPAGTETADVFMKLVEISEDDRLVSAHSSVADAVELIPPGSAPEGELGIPMTAGTDLSLNARNGHLRLHNVRMDLQTGNQYPMTLVFDGVGPVEVDFVIEPD